MIPSRRATSSTGNVRERAFAGKRSRGATGDRTVARKRSRGATGDRTVARERSRGATGDRTVARERSRGAMGDRIVARERSRGATFRATVVYEASVLQGRDREDIAGRIPCIKGKARRKGHECDPVGESDEKGGPTTPGSQTHQSSDGQRGVTDAAVAKPGRVDNASSQKSGG